MKLIKKIAAIMFAFMMVVSMSCNVKADEGTTPTPGETGTITINNAIPEQTYTIYKILDLESYSSKEENGKETGNFAYKPSSEWESFIKGENVKDKYFTFEGEYVSWKENANPAEFAKLALDYAKQDGSTVKTSTTNTAPAASAGQTTSTVTFDKLSLGYYLVDSSVGTLCSLDTTKPTVEIKEKNGVPSVEKKVYNGTDYDDSNNANIGDTISFQTTINVKKGATNYKLHDEMSNGLKLIEQVGSSYVSAIAYNNDGTGKSNLKKDDDYIITVDSNLNKFDIDFTKYTDQHTNEEYKIVVVYNAILQSDAVIGNSGNLNKTWLTYGDNNTETNKSETITKTFEMKVFKFYKDKNDSNTEKGLAGATFKLTKGSEDANNITFVKTSNKTATNDVYRVAKKGEAGTVTTITSPDSGKFKIQGLGAGTYYLTETKQPAGYNKLSGPVTVVIDGTGLVKVGESEANPVKVENKTGTVLPSTGGAGTTMIYLVGAVLVLGSGVVLATKRRVKNK
jgi:LPXTG-motif cell wall-anchored protein